MFVAGIDAHATYSVIAIVSNTGQLVAGPIRSSTLLTVRATAHPPRIDPGRGQPLAEGHLRPRRREPRRYRSSPRSCCARDAAYG